MGMKAIYCGATCSAAESTLHFSRVSSAVQQSLQCSAAECPVQCSRVSSVMQQSLKVHTAVEHCTTVQCSRVSSAGQQSLQPLSPGFWRPPRVSRNLEKSKGGVLEVRKFLKKLQ